MSPVINGDDILELFNGNPPVIEGLLDIEEQLQPNGIDLTVKTIASITSSGVIGFNNKDRILSESSSLSFNNFGFIDLTIGCYLITYNEVVHIPCDVIALGLPRSSLLRCGASIHTAVWDAGYSGRSQSLLVVYNSKGFRLYKNAKVLQLIFLKLSHSVAHGYQGIFQKENI
jgi:dUTP pyrophosphatase